MKFGTVTYIGPLQRIVRKITIFLKIQHGGGAMLKITKIAIFPQRFDQSLRKMQMQMQMQNGSLNLSDVTKLNFKNPRWRTAAILKTA